MQETVPFSSAGLIQVLHGRRKFVPRGVGLSPLTNATLILSCQRVMSGTLRRLPVLNRRKVRMTSGLHGPYNLGYTCATLADTVRRKAATLSQTPKSV